MEVKDLLPVGSIVFLNNAVKRIVIIGVMQIKKLSDNKFATYDYMGVPYPEGIMGAKTMLLFNHDSVKDVVFRGYEDEEREKFIGLLEKIHEQSDSIMKSK